MTPLNYLIGILAFMSMVICSYSKSLFTVRPAKTDSSNTGDRNPEVDISSLSSHLRYPEIARRADLEGPMLVWVLVGADGTIVKYHYEVSLGPLFEKAVDEALKFTTFTPGRYKGEAVSIPVTLPVIFRLRGTPRLSLNYHEQVIYTLTALQRLDPENRSKYLYLRGKEHFKNREYDYAIADYEEYSSMVQETQKLYYENEMLSMVSEALPKDTVNLDSLVKRGQIFANHYLYDQAIETFNIVINRDSNNRDALQSRAGSFTKCKDYEQAIDDLKKITHLNNTDSTAYLSLGWNCYMLGKMNECIEFSERAIQLSTNDYTSRYNRALAYLRLNQIDRAKELYKETISLQGAQDGGARRGAISDLKNLIHDKILVEESKSILKDLFKISDQDVAWRW